MEKQENKKMKMDDVLAQIKGLSRSQGFYGRLYSNLMELKNEDPNNFAKYSKFIEDQEFETALDVVLFFEEGVSPKESRKPKKKVWKIPVTWEMYGHVEIEGDSIEEAIEKFHEIEEDLPLPTDADYVDGSFALSDDDEENLKGLIALMNKENLEEEA